MGVEPRSIMKEMRTANIAALAVVLAGCAHAQARETRTVEHVEAASSAEPEAREEREVVAVDAPAPVEAELPRSRPRLSRTVTLGEASAEAAYTERKPLPAPGQAGGPNVVVNNQVIVQQPSYGYGGYGYGYGYGGRAVARSDRLGARGTSTWGSSGWEGPRRTAAPGQTPGIGGNWAPAPSYGPAPMK
jgi:hypothetical protein